MAVEEEKGRRSDLRLKYCFQPPPLFQRLSSLPSSRFLFHPSFVSSSSFLLQSRDSRNERLINSPFYQTWKESMANDDKAVYCLTLELGNRLRRG